MRRVSDWGTPADHRSYPPPATSWLMRQVWHDLLFAHWPIPPDTLRALIPPGLSLDTFDRQAWLGIVPFRMSGIRPRFLPALPWLSAFPELNARTYVIAGDRPGVWFFSLDAGNPVAVAVARRAFHLPYFNARMGLAREPLLFNVSSPLDWIAYTSTRTHRHAPPASFTARYRPIDDMRPAQPGTLEHWLTERYCLYATDRAGRLYRGEIHHAPWPLQPAEAEITTNTIAAAAGISLPDTQPLLHFARRLDVLIWALRQLRVEG